MLGIRRSNNPTRPAPDCSIVPSPRIQPAGCGIGNKQVTDGVQTPDAGRSKKAPAYGDGAKSHFGGHKACRRRVRGALIARHHVYVAVFCDRTATTWPSVAGHSFFKIDPHVPEATHRGNGPAQYLRAVRYRNKTAAEFAPTAVIVAVPRPCSRNAPLCRACRARGARAGPCLSWNTNAARGCPWHALQTWDCYLAGLDYRSHCTGCNPASASSRSSTSSASPGLQVRRPTLPVNPLASLRG